MSLLVFVRRTNGNKTTWDGVWNGDVLRVEEGDIQFVIGKTHVKIDGKTKDFDIIEGSADIFKLPFETMSIGDENYTYDGVDGYANVDSNQSMGSGNPVVFNGISDDTLVERGVTYLSGNVNTIDGVDSDGTVESFDRIAYDNGTINVYEGVSSDSIVNSYDSNVFTDGGIVQKNGILGYVNSNNGVSYKSSYSSSVEHVKRDTFSIDTKFTSTYNDRADHVKRDTFSIDTKFTSTYNERTDHVKRDTFSIDTKFTSTYNDRADHVKRDTFSIDSSYYSINNSYDFINGDFSIQLPTSGLPTIVNILSQGEETNVTSDVILNSVNTTNIDDIDDTSYIINGSNICVSELQETREHIEYNRTTITRTLIEDVTYYENDDPKRVVLSDTSVSVDTIEKEVEVTPIYSDNWCFDSNNIDLIDNIINTLETPTDDLISLLEQRVRII